MSQSQAELTNREEWILRFLYAPANDRRAAPVVGTTRLMKGLFLVHKKFEEKFGSGIGFGFRPDKYGPLDEGVYDAIESLQDGGYISAGKSDEYDGDEYRLTPKGERLARDLYDDLGPKQQELVEWIKAKHVLRELSKLLSYVYSRYPQSAEESVFDG